MTLSGVWWASLSITRSIRSGSGDPAPAVANAPAADPPAMFSLLRFLKHSNTPQLYQSQTAIRSAMHLYRAFITCSGCSYTFIQLYHCGAHHWTICLANRQTVYESSNSHLCLIQKCTDDIGQISTCNQQHLFFWGQCKKLVARFVFGMPVCRTNAPTIHAFGFKYSI